jgi:hypothetical protein
LQREERETIEKFDFEMFYYGKLEYELLELVEKTLVKFCGRLGNVKKSTPQFLVEIHEEESSSSDN